VSALDLVIQQLDTQNLSGADRRLPARTFAFGSEIVKLIWEIIPDNGKAALRLYDPVSPPVLSGSLQLLPISGWQARYRIDPDKHMPCPSPPKLPPYGSAQSDVPIPINCFYWFSINKNGNNGDPCSDLSQDIKVVWCKAATKQQGFLVFLVGFHVMKFTPGSPDWIWSTYYWTRERNQMDNGRDWNAPWDHFHQMTTTAIRENAGDHAISYSPYLEGQDNNGLKANCLSCHSFAAYAPSVDKVGSGTEHGREYPYPRAKRLLNEQDYFRDAVQTSFVWSISTSQNKPSGGKDPTLFQGILEQMLQEQLHNQ
jgi:hypothetical protein